MNDCTEILPSEEPLPLTARPPGVEGFGSLADRLAEEMATCWQQGERPTAEEFLCRYAELKDDHDAALKLVCEEICLRQEYGQEKAVGDVLDRYPHWRPRLEALLENYRRSRQGRRSPGFPSAGEVWTDFQILAELGRGTYGRVFLAVEPRLANRPVILKMASAGGGEHLSLARLQHTHIVPLYAVQEDPTRNLWAICMPYFGGTSFAQLLEALKAKPAAQRTGRDLLQALDQIQAQYPVRVPSRGPARQLLAGATYVQAVCWMGACLAEGLQHAHERGLVHLDVKPANILLAADGQPMLLDFHLAQEPVRNGGKLPGRFGGTPKYMSPEQRLLASTGRTRPREFPTVDGRSDIYSLGLVVYEALGGEIPFPVPASLPSLHRQNPQVTVGLADIIHKCLASEPGDRYRDAAALAADLRRHLSDLPLLGVKNRRLTERWQKWRRRRPHALPVAVMLLLVVLAGFGVARYAVGHVSQRLHDAEAALVEGQEQLRCRAYAEAERSFARGLASTEGIPGSPELVEKLGLQLHRARRGQAADHLHVLANRIRLLYGDASRNAKEVRSLDEYCQKVWNTRSLLRERADLGLEPAVEQQIHADLLDLAILWADLRGRSATDGQSHDAYRDALQVLTQAEELLGPSVILARERQTYAAKLGLTEVADDAARRANELVPRTAWEHFCLGRSLLGSGKLVEAVAEFDRALLLNPQDFWASFYRGQCAYRLKRYEDAVSAFSICLALRPTSAHCFHNRALAQASQGNTDKALLDYDRALQLDPTLAAAALNRGILHYTGKRYPAAIADLQRALDIGADAATVHYNLALVQLAQGDRANAVASLRSALQQGGEQAEARDLLNRLLHKP